jgi:hypothetical protein
MTKHAATAENQYSWFAHDDLRGGDGTTKRTSESEGERSGKKQVHQDRHELGDQTAPRICSTTETVLKRIPISLSSDQSRM